MTRWARIAGCVVFAAGALAAAIQTLTGTKHDFSGRCELCHTSPNVGTGLLKNLSAVDAQCRQCHDARPGASHPVGMMVTAQLPAGFPLDETGRMTCLTCHRAHQPPDGLPLEHLLRGGTAGEELCSQCHAQSHKVAERDAHALAFGEAHDQVEPEGAVIGGVDQRSMVCLSCHDDLSAGSSGVSVGRAGSGKAKWTSHPVGVPYPVGRGPRGGYRPRSAISPAIKLFDDKLACESCHNLYSSIENYLVMSNARSRLCLDCHDK